MHDALHGPESAPPPAAESPQPRSGLPPAAALHGLLPRYGAAIGFTIIALLATLAAEGQVPRTVALLFVAAVAVSTSYGGLGPGPLSGLLSVLALEYSFTPPSGSLTPTDLSNIESLLVFALVAGLIGWLGVGLQRSRDDARAAEARYRALFNGTADAIIVTAADGRYLEVNDAACRLLGYTADELKGMKAGGRSPPMSNAPASSSRVCSAKGGGGAKQKFDARMARPSA